MSQVSLNDAELLLLDGRVNAAAQRVIERIKLGVEDRKIDQRTRAAEMIALLDCCTLEQIGQRYGITRERVRQIAKQYGVIAGDKRKSRTQKARIEQQLASTAPIPGFKRRMQAWLRSTGWFQCCQCHGAFEITHFGKLQQCRCRRCTANNVNRLYHDPNSPVRENNLRWQKERREIRRLHERLAE